MLKNRINGCHGNHALVHGANEFEDKDSLHYWGPNERFGPYEKLSWVCKVGQINTLGFCRYDCIRIIFIIIISSIVAAIIIIIIIIIITVTVRHSSCYLIIELYCQEFFDKRNPGMIVIQKETHWPCCRAPDFKRGDWGLNPSSV